MSPPRGQPSPLVEDSCTWCWSEERKSFGSRQNFMLEDCRWHCVNLVGGWGWGVWFWAGMKLELMTISL